MCCERRSTGPSQGSRLSWVDRQVLIQSHITFALGLGLGLAGSAACQERRERRRPKNHLHLIKISTRCSDLPPLWRTGGVLAQLRARGMLLKLCSGVSGATELGEETETCKKTRCTALRTEGHEAQSRAALHHVSTPTEFKMWFRRPALLVYIHTHDPTRSDAGSGEQVSRSYADKNARLTHTQGSQTHAPRILHVVYAGGQHPWPRALSYPVHVCLSPAHRRDAAALARCAKVLGQISTAPSSRKYHKIRSYGVLTVRTGLNCQPLQPTTCSSFY